MQKNVFLALVLALVAASSAIAQENRKPTPEGSTVLSDEDAIKQTVLDYEEGYYEGNADRMERALHPDLAKRSVRNDNAGHSRLDQMSAMTLVQITRTGSGKKTLKEEQLKNVKIFEIFGNTATVKAEMRDWIDYMHVAKFNGQWKIVNVLWEMKPSK